MIHVFLICLACCCSSLIPLKQSESIVSEDHIQVVERKSKNNMFGAYGNCYTASDFLSYDFGQYFYDYISDFDSPSTNNLTYTHGGAKFIQYVYRSDNGPIGQLTTGGYSNNLIGDSPFSNLYTRHNAMFVSYTNGVVTFRITGLDDPYIYFDNTFDYGDNKLCTLSVTDNTYIEKLSLNGVSNSLTPSTTLNNGSYRIGFEFQNASLDQLVSFSVMLNEGNSALPYEPFFTGAVQYGGVTASIMKINVDSVFNSQYNTYGYNYFLGFYTRVASEDRLVLGIHSMVIPNLKWLDNQSNIYDAGLFVYSSIELNPSLSQYNLHNFVWREQSEYTIKPITTYYFNKRAMALSNDESNALYNQGYDVGYNNGNTAGYQRGYSEGVSYAQEQSSTALTIFTGIIEVGLLPVNVFLKMFEYEVFGINIAGLVSGLITIAMIMILLRFIFGGKQNGK